MKTFWTKPPKNRIYSVQMKDEHCAEKSFIKKLKRI